MVNVLSIVDYTEDGMVNVTSKRCIHLGCKTQPIYNKLGETNGLYCREHRQDGMVNVKSNKCIHEGCKKRPSYNKIGEIKALYCLSHIIDGMVNILQRTCIHEGCKKTSYYNKEGARPIYCSQHIQDGMMNVVQKTCIHPGCKTQPSYNKEGETIGLYCATHRKEGMIDVKSTRCKTHLCSTRVTEKYDGYCFYCYMHLFPDKPITHNYKTKEFSVVEYVKANYPHPWITDKITGGCSRRRPDLLLDLIDQVLIVEIDENQHIDYDCSCENKRIMELSQDLAHRPIVFIRFNPDDYQKGDIKVTSCWGQNQKGICVVKKTKKVEWEERLRALGETIEYWLNHRTDKTVEIIQLFYDSI